MQDSSPRGSDPRDPAHGSSPDPRPGSGSAGGSAPVRIAAAAAGLALLASAFVIGDAWATAAGVLAAVAGVGLGITALVRARRSTARGLVVALAVVGIVWGAFSAVGGGTRLLVWPATEVYQDCTARALTLSSTRRCEQQLNENVWNHFSGRELDTAFPESPNASPEVTARREVVPVTPSPDVTPSPVPSSAGSASPSGLGSVAPSPTR